MKQFDLFGKETDGKDGKYTKKIPIPIYEPKGKPPHILELCDNGKFIRLRREIAAADISEDEKKFLYFAATRHLVFNYSKTADYYAYASKDMQELMERSALVIIDFEAAILNGYVKLSNKVIQTFLKAEDNEK